MDIIDLKHPRRPTPQIPRVLSKNIKQHSINSILPFSRSTVFGMSSPARSPVLVSCPQNYFLWNHRIYCWSSSCRSAWSYSSDGSLAWMGTSTQYLSEMCLTCWARERREGSVEIVGRKTAFGRGGESDPC